jgi:uncharacterized protein
MPPRPFIAFGDYLRRKFGCKVYRVTVDAGFNCPNRDGRVGADGCIYCRTDSFAGDTDRRLPIAEQMRRGIERVRKRYGAAKFIAYFQPFTNTYADAATLKSRYDEALVSPDVVGLCIGTRPDCVPSETLDLVAEYSRRTEVWLEFGLQSARDATLRAINRGHDFATFADAVTRAQSRGIKICAHVILGLPGETREDMLATAGAIANQGIAGVKMHHLHVVKGTRLEQMWQRDEVRVLAVEEYVPLAVDFLQRLPPDIIVHRLVGDCRYELLVAPHWTQSKGEITRMIEAGLIHRRNRVGGA